jgi:beta-glucanase (GH16 family)
VVAKLPKGDWLWPAILLLPSRNVYGGWPASGQINLMESRGNANYPRSAEGGCDSFSSTLHWGVDWTENRHDKTHQVYHHSNGSLSDSFHTFGLYWSKDRLYTYIDNPNNTVLDVDLKENFFRRGQFSAKFQNPWRGEEGAPFNQEFHIVISLAVGGNIGYFPDYIDNKPWLNSSPKAAQQFLNAIHSWDKTWLNSNFEIDSIKVWSFK